MHGATSTNVATKTEVPKMTGGFKYVKGLLPNQRASLAHGKRIHFRNSTGDHVILGTDHEPLSLPLALFKAVSSAPDTIVDDHINLPRWVTPGPLFYLIDKISAIPFIDIVEIIDALEVVRKDTYITIVENPHRELLICSVADFFGMGSWTTSMLSKYMARATTAVPPMALVQAIEKVETPTGDRILTAMARHLARAYMDFKLPSKCRFERDVLDKTSRLATAFHREEMLYAEEVLEKARNGIPPSTPLEVAWAAEVQRLKTEKVMKSLSGLDLN